MTKATILNICFQFQKLSKLINIDLKNTKITTIKSGLIFISTNQAAPEVL